MTWQGKRNEKERGEEMNIGALSQRIYEIALWSVIPLHTGCIDTVSTTWWNIFIDSHLCECVCKERWNAGTPKMCVVSRTNGTSVLDAISTKCCFLCYHHHNAYSVDLNPMQGFTSKNQEEEKRQQWTFGFYGLFPIRLLSLSLSLSIVIRRKENFILFDNDSTKTTKNAKGMLIHI